MLLNSFQRIDTICSRVMVNSPGMVGPLRNARLERPVQVVTQPELGN
jgi:hypothetical protein